MWFNWKNVCLKERPRTQYSITDRKIGISSQIPVIVPVNCKQTVSIVKMIPETYL